MVDDSTLTRAARDLVCAQNFGGTLLRLVRGGVTAITTALMEKATAVETGAERSSTATTRR